MKHRTGFIRTTIVGGVVFLVPLVIVVAIVGTALQLTRDIAEPLADALQIETASEAIVINLLAVLLILAVCFLAGVLAQTPAATRFVRSVEQRLLDRIPGYTFVKGITASLSEAKEGGGMTPIHIRFDDHAQIAFEVERLGDGSVVAYLPGAPIPWSGSVRIVAADRVTSLDATMLAAAGTFERLGRGSGALLRPPEDKP